MVIPWRYRQRCSRRYPPLWRQSWVCLSFSTALSQITTNVSLRLRIGRPWNFPEITQGALSEKTGLNRKASISYYAMMNNLFRYFDSSPEVIRLAVMMCIRYPLSLRKDEDVLFE